MSRVMQVVGRAKDTHGYRAWTRYGDARGNVLAGGIAYMAFFSVIPALILGLSVFGLLLRNQPDVYDNVVSSLSNTLPGVIKDVANPRGLVDASNPPTPDALTVAGLISLVTLLLAGLGWLSALRGGVRAVFGRPSLSDNILRSKLRDLSVMIVLGLAFLVSGVLSTGVSAAATWLLTQVGVADSDVGQVVLRTLTVLVVLLVDVALMLVVFRLLSGLRLPREDLLHGALVGAVGLGIIKLAGGLLLAGAARKPVLGAFAVLVGLLVVLNLMARVMLLASAWAASTAAERGRLTDTAAGVLATQTLPPGGAAPRVSGSPAAREALTAGSPHGLQPSYGQRAADRTTIAAGAVLGVAALVGLRAVRRGAGAALDAVRGDADRLGSG